jgi:pimeloyl-ACP methyl ester carboxylesterase
MSSGAVLALEAAARGLAITKLALYEPPFNSGDDNARRASENYTKQLTTLLAEGRRGDAVAFAMTTWGTPADAIAGMRQTPAWPILESVAPTLAYDNAIMGAGFVPTKRMASITVPTLVIDGGASPAFMHNAAQAAADALPIIPTALGQLLGDKDPQKSQNVMQAMLKMTKIDIATLRRAYEQK